MTDHQNNDETERVSSPQPMQGGGSPPESRAGLSHDERELRVSMLIDGELAGEELTETIEDVLGDIALQDELKKTLALRKVTQTWMRHEPLHPFSAADEGAGRQDVFPAKSPPGDGLRRAWTPTTPTYAATLLLLAVVTGGLLVSVGLLLGRQAGERPGNGQPSIVQAGKHPQPPNYVEVDAEQIQQVGEVFAFHESVAGPLAWYAAGERDVRFAPLENEQSAGRPIAMQIRISTEQDGSTERSVIVVCREGMPSRVALPWGQSPAGSLWMYVAPAIRGEDVQVRYTLTLDTAESPDASTSLSGRRVLGVRSVPLGQMASDDGLLTVQASAWIIPRQGTEL